jgi:hypothetical protein
MTPAAQDLCGVCLLSVTYLIVVADFASPLEEFPTSVSHLGKRPQTPAVPNPVTNRHLIGLISISSATGLRLDSEISPPGESIGGPWGTSRGTALRGADAVTGSRRAEARLPALTRRRSQGMGQVCGATPISGGIGGGSPDARRPVGSGGQVGAQAPELVPWGRAALIGPGDSPGPVGVSATDPARFGTGPGRR